MTLVFDMDGCICHSDFPSNFIIKNSTDIKDDMNKYQKALPFQKALYVLKVLYLSFKIIILTGREDYSRKVTKDWLKMYNFPYHKLVTMKYGWRNFDEYINFKIENIKRIRPILVVDDFQPVLDKVSDIGISTYKISREEDWDLNKILKKVI